MQSDKIYLKMLVHQRKKLDIFVKKISKRVIKFTTIISIIYNNLLVIEILHLKV